LIGTRNKLNASASNKNELSKQNESSGSPHINRFLTRKIVNSDEYYRKTFKMPQSFDKGKLQMRATSQRRDLNKFMKIGVFSSSSGKLIIYWNRAG